jgi:DNA-binding transcriptional LysR family regulator
LVSILPDKLNIEKLDLLQNKLYMVGNKNIAMNKKDILKTLPLIFREEGSGTRQTMEKFITKNKMIIPKKMELTSNEAVKQALLAGLGYSIMPLIGLKNEIHNKELHIIPMKGLPIKTNWSLIWLKGKNHSPISNSFLTYLKNYKAEIVHDKFDWYEKHISS